MEREKASESFKGRGGAQRGFLPKNSPERRGPHAARVGHGCTRDAPDHRHHAFPVFSPLHVASVQINHGNTTLHHSEACVQENLNYLFLCL